MKKIIVIGALISTMSTTAAAKSSCPVVKKFYQQALLEMMDLQFQLKLNTTEIMKKYSYEQVLVKFQTLNRRVALYSSRGKALKCGDMKVSKKQINKINAKYGL